MKTPSSLAIFIAIPCLFTSVPAAEPETPADQNVTDEAAVEAGIRDLAWKLQPDTLVTRGAMETPEQSLPGTALPEPWEACFTLGTQWQFKPTNETYKSGTRLIEMLIETRAKGGNLLLNVGPEPSGAINNSRWPNPIVVKLTAVEPTP